MSIGKKTVEFLKELREELERVRDRKAKVALELNKLSWRETELIMSIKGNEALIKYKENPENSEIFIPFVMPKQVIVLPQIPFPEKPLKVKDAILWCLNNINGDIPATSIRDFLVRLKDEGKFKSNAENLLWVTHSGLRTLIKKGLVVKLSNGNYILREKI